MSETRRVLTAHWDDPSVVALAGYEAAGGYRALRTALGMSADELIQLVKDSGLRGRGGAGFPTGMKWSFVPRDTGKPTYVTVNFDESEPGTCNNRELVEREPHALIEGAAIAARAIDCHLAYIYIRGEYLWQGQVLQRALDEAYAAGLPRPRHHGQRRTISTSCCTGARAPTSAARRRRCSRASRASGASLGCVRRSRRSRGCTSRRR